MRVSSGAGAWMPPWRRRSMIHCCSHAIMACTRLDCRGANMPAARASLSGGWGAACMHLRHAAPQHQRRPVHFRAGYSWVPRTAADNERSDPSGSDRAWPHGSHHTGVQNGPNLHAGPNPPPEGWQRQWLQGGRRAPLLSRKP